MKVLLKLKKTVISFLIIGLLALSMSVPVLALSTQDIDTSKHGSITINKSSVSTIADDSLSGIKFTVYQVAEFSNSKNYILTPSFSGSGLSLVDLPKASASVISTAAKNLASYVSGKSISESSNFTNSSGTVKFENLALGYYLVVQSDNSKNQKSHSVCDPFLVAVPMQSSDGNSWIYDIIANSKSEDECGAVILQKTNASGTSLSGAIFRLEKKIYYTDSVGLPSGVQTGSDKSGNFFWNTLVSELTTNQFGQIAVKSMPYGQYRFIEIVAPAGYVLNSTPHEFSVSVPGSVTLVNGKYVTAFGTVPTITVLNSYPPYYPPYHPPYYPPSSSSQSSSSVPPTTTVSDTSTPQTPPTDTEDINDGKVPQAGFDLPKTGGSVCYAVCTYGGIILMICGVAVFVASRKKKA